MSINLVTFANQTVTPTNDAIIYEKAVNQNGIFNGCAVTVNTNQINIAGGYGIICGREFTVEAESISVTLAGSGTLLGRLYVRLDLSNPSTPIQLLTATGSTLPALTQDDDVNFNNGVWEMELATFTVGVNDITDLVQTFEIIAGSVNASRIQTGTLSSVSVSASSYTDIAVTFTTPMPSTPVVVCSLVSLSTASAIGSMEVAAINASKTGFTCRIFNDSASTRAPGVSWIAVI
jgi:hypothetical protein